MQKHAELPEWLKSKNDFYEAAKYIKADAKNFEVSSGDKKVLNNLVTLIIDIINNRAKNKSH